MASTEKYIIDTRPKSKWQQCLNQWLSTGYKVKVVNSVPVGEDKAFMVVKRTKLLT